MALKSGSIPCGLAAEILIGRIGRVAVVVPPQSAIGAKCEGQSRSESRPAAREQCRRDPKRCARAADRNSEPVLLRFRRRRERLGQVVCLIKLDVYGHVVPVKPIGVGKSPAEYFAEARNRTLKPRQSVVGAARRTHSTSSSSANFNSSRGQVQLATACSAILSDELSARNRAELRDRAYERSIDDTGYLFPIVYCAHRPCWGTRMLRGFAIASASSSGCEFEQRQRPQPHSTADTDRTSAH